MTAAAHSCGYMATAVYFEMQLIQKFQAIYIVITQ